MCDLQWFAPHAQCRRVFRVGMNNRPHVGPRLVGVNALGPLISETSYLKKKRRCEWALTRGQSPTGLWVGTLGSVRGRTFWVPNPVTSPKTFPTTFPETVPETFPETSPKLPRNLPSKHHGKSC